MQFLVECLKHIFTCADMKIRIACNCAVSEKRANIVVQLARIFLYVVSRCISGFYDFTYVNLSNFNTTVCVLLVVGLRLTGYTATNNAAAGYRRQG